MLPDHGCFPGAPKVGAPIREHAVTRPMSQASISGTRVARRHSMSEDSLEGTPYRERIEQLLMRIEGEFLDTPGLMLTLPQAERRFGVDEITCEAILEALVDAKVLFKTRGRVYGRLMPHLWAA